MTKSTAWSSGGSGTCVGGAKAELAASVAEALRRAGFAATQPCKSLPGVDPANIVNRAQAGVQLELTKGLRKRLASDPKALDRYAAAVRAAVRASLPRASAVP